MLLNILLALLIIVGVSLTGLVLLQRSEGGALGMGGGGGQLVSARGAANFLTRTTWILGGSFFVLALLITVLLGRQEGADSITDEIKIENADPTKLAADKQAAIDRANAADAAGKQGQTGGFSAPAPSLGLNPMTPQAASAPSPFAAPPPTTLAPAPKAAPKAAPQPAPKAAPKAAASAPAPAAPPPIPIIPTPGQ